MRLIIIGGAKHTKKDLVAMRLANNSDCIWIRPYTDVETPVNMEDYQQDLYIHLNPKQLDAKMKREEPLAVCHIGDNRYVFFENQLTSGYCVLVGDDQVITYLKKNWDGELITIKCHSKDEEYSARDLLTDDEFDIIFNVDNGDYDELEELVGDIYHFKEGFDE